MLVVLSRRYLHRLRPTTSFTRPHPMSLRPTLRRSCVNRSPLSHSSTSMHRLQPPSNQQPLNWGASVRNSVGNTASEWEGCRRQRAAGGPGGSHEHGCQLPHHHMHIAAGGAVVVVGGTEEVLLLTHGYDV